MARPLSWLPRLAVIRRSVSNSVRTHYDRRALELLFEIQPRAAGKLLAMLTRSAPLGTSHLVAREILLGFLGSIHEADDPSRVMAQAKTERSAVSRKKPRELIRREFETIEPAALAKWIERGHFKGFDFEKIDQVFDVMWRFACAVEGEGLEKFIALYEPIQALNAEKQALRAEREAFQVEIEEMRTRWQKTQETGHSCPVAAL